MQEDNSTLARRIVDYVLEWVDKTGKFHGKGPDRGLTFPLIVSRDGSTESVIVRIYHDVTLMLEDQR